MALWMEIKTISLLFGKEKMSASLQEYVVDGGGVEQTAQLPVSVVSHTHSTLLKKKPSSHGMSIHRPWLQK